MPGQTAYHGLLDIGQPKEGVNSSYFSSLGAVGAVSSWAKLRSLKVAESLV